MLVASSEAKLTDRKADLWNSGKISSGQSVFVEYDGNPLESGRTYYWTVRVWNQDEQATEWSLHKKFHTGFYDKSDWKASWIGAYESESKFDYKRPRSILLRKELKLNTKIRQAKVYVTGMGSYQLFLNGEKVSKDLLTPGWTDYPARIMYQVYDITDNLNVQ